MTWQTASNSSDATFALAAQLGQKCKGGEIFELVSDLGGGKTTFTQGLARGLGSTEHVGSPTFTINRQYHGRDGLLLQHFDFYRLADPGIVRLELQEVLDDPSCVVAIEWGDSVEDVLPPHTVKVELARTGEDSRRLTFSFPAERKYLFEGLS